MMNCLNCDKPVPEQDARLFASVFCCPTCFEVASRLYQRLEGELKKLLIISKETIRVALIEGKLHYASGEERDVSKEELLRMITQMSEKKDAERSSRG